VTPKGATETRRRGQQLTDALFAAAWDVLVDDGYAGFTFDAIAARADTSRTVLYRRWATRDELLLDTLAHFWAARPIEVPDTGTLRDDAIGLLRNADAVRAQLTVVMSVQMAGYYRATGTSIEDVRQRLGPATGPTGLEQIVARAVARGEIADAARSSRVVNLPFQLLRHEMFMTMRPVTDEAIAEIIDDVWLPLLGISCRPAPR
jgi:AcrR family transcriptional regulator